MGGCGDPNLCVWRPQPVGVCQSDPEDQEAASTIVLVLLIEEGGGAYK